MKEPSIPKVDDAKVGFFRHRRLGKKILVTNDSGCYVLLDEKDFLSFVEGRLDPKKSLHGELRRKGFIRDQMDFTKMAEDWRRKHGFLWHGPSLHIIVVTLKCNHRCVYCQTSSVGMDRGGFDMTQDTAKRVVDVAFQSPNRALTIEFQGGEPLANWPVVRFVVDYARKKNVSARKGLFLNLVTNLTLMDEEKLDFLLGSGVNICTSVDGPAKLHNANRIFLGGSSHAIVMKWWDKIRKRTKGKTFGVDALMTTTRRSLKFPREIVDQYIKMGARGIYLRPLSRYGFADKIWEKVGYGPDEFLAFYRKAVDHIIDRNRKRKTVFEQTAAMLAMKILKNEDPNFMDLRTPCGAGIGQIAYNYDGKVYTCDEGRMLSRMGDEAFRIGDVASDGYPQIINHPAVRAVASSSCLDCQAECAGCAYLPYCGICPVENYFAQGDLFARTPLSGRCRVMKGILDYLFDKLRKPADKKIIKAWTRVPTALRQD